MTLIEAAVVILAGVCAGIINTVVGSGTLVTFPVLLWTGLPPVGASVANNIGGTLGSISGAIGYRKELSGTRRRLARVSVAAMLGGLTGAILLVMLPPGVFRVVVPVLIALALGLVLAEPWLGRRLMAWRESAPQQGSRSLIGAIFGASAYGGYFGAAQGVILLAVMGLLTREPLQQINALKNVVHAVGGSASAVLFILIAQVDWASVLLLGSGAIIGGQIGARVGRRLPPAMLRAAIVVIGVVGIVQVVS
jgi:uncharacterized membrane protein YfcA